MTPSQKRKPVSGYSFAAGNKKAKRTLPERTVRLIQRPLGLGIDFRSTGQSAGYAIRFRAEPYRAPAAELKGLNQLSPSTVPAFGRYSQPTHP